MSIPLDENLCLKLYERMLTIRMFEEKAIELFEHNLIRGNVHPCIGQEAVSAGVCATLRRDDYMLNTHRGHGNCIAKGADLKRMMAELLGKETGYCRGKGGSMHIADFEGGNLGANGIVGGGIPIAVGAGISVQNRGTDQVVVCFFGDGATNQGTFHESLNLAALWKLPVVFICENNQYGLSTPVREAVSIFRISDRAIAYGIPGVSLDGNDVIEVYTKTVEAVERARAGEGPALLDCVTYRFFGHFTGDPGRGINYRSKEEMNQWLDRCPVKQFKEQLFREKIVTEETGKAIEAKVRASIEEAVRFAKESPFPSPEETTQDLFLLK
ncbi:MAG: thiamine pyrophosphate-dependent dehydrogenase E1 component subunit alpha [Deltaproteobacteria bacterium]|nr:thiamine pyrophosphate-dependent dehydrogenase E1 component subunit alpha [Deltaproteobacteria bacterium]